MFRLYCRSPVRASSCLVSSACPRAFVSRHLSCLCTNAWTIASMAARTGNDRYRPEPQRAQLRSGRVIRGPAADAQSFSHKPYPLCPRPLSGPDRQGHAAAPNLRPSRSISLCPCIYRGTCLPPQASSHRLVQHTWHAVAHIHCTWQVYSSVCSWHAPVGRSRVCVLGR